MQHAFTFDDVALVPQYNNIPSRTEPNLETWLTKNQKIRIVPIKLLDDVYEQDLAKIKKGISFSKLHVRIERLLKYKFESTMYIH